MCRDKNSFTTVSFHSYFFRTLLIFSFMIFWDFFLHGSLTQTVSYDNVCEYFQ